MNVQLRRKLQTKFDSSDINSTDAKAYILITHSFEILKDILENVTISDTAELILSFVFNFSHIKIYVREPSIKSYTHLLRLDKAYPFLGIREYSVNPELVLFTEQEKILRRHIILDDMPKLNELIKKSPRLNDNNVMKKILKNINKYGAYIDMKELDEIVGGTNADSNSIMIPVTMLLRSLHMNYRSILYVPINMFDVTITMVNAKALLVGNYVTFLKEYMNTS